MRACMYVCFVFTCACAHVTSDATQREADIAKGRQGIRHRSVAVANQYALPPSRSLVREDPVVASPLQGPRRSDAVHDGESEIAIHG